MLCPLLYHERRIIALTNVKMIPSSKKLYVPTRKRQLTHTTHPVLCHVNKQTLPHDHNFHTKNPDNLSVLEEEWQTWFSQHGHTYECATPPAENQTVNQLNGHLTETSVERHNHRKPLVWINHIYKSLFRHG